jgi:GMP synthase-like glutamine amidotransferase
MHIHWLQHVPFEGLGVIQNWANRHGHRLSCTRFWAGDRLPEPDLMDMLVVMGGPMGTRDEQRYSWLEAEKAFLCRAVAGNAVLLGICLGAQLLAEVCGAAVSANQQKEIGWFEVSPEATAPDWFSDILPLRSPMFHWHGDSFDIPGSAVRLASSAACKNQGFALADRIIGLQFHPEMSASDIASLVDHCRFELIPGPSVQTEEQIIAGSRYIESANQFMHRLLDHCSLQVA